MLSLTRAPPAVSTPADHEAGQGPAEDDSSRVRPPIASVSVRGEALTDDRAHDSDRQREGDRVEPECGHVPQLWAATRSAVARSRTLRRRTTTVPDLAAPQSSAASPAHTGHGAVDPAGAERIAGREAGPGVAGSGCAGRGAAGGGCGRGAGVNGRSGGRSSAIGSS